MATSWGPMPGPAADGCAELRQEVASLCEEAHKAEQARAATEDQARTRKRDLVAAQHQLEAAVAAADPASRRADKAAARDTYLLASKTATSDAEGSDALAAWASAIDRINRQSRLAARALDRARARVGAAKEALQQAQRAEQQSRFRAEAAQAACLDGRVRLATCEERLADPAAGPASPFDPYAGTGGHAVRIGGTGGYEPLVIEALVDGDEVVLEATARAIAERGALSPAEARLQLRELIDAIVAAAAEDGHLVFDERHPLWSQLTQEQSHDVTAALGRLGFQLEPRKGWQAGRQPGAADLSMALGYAGLDARHTRTLPAAVDLAALPASVDVDARALLVARAPELGVDSLARVLGRRAAPLGSLWDAWGLVRPVLLAERHVVLVGHRAGLP